MSTDTFNFVAQVLGSVAAVVALSQAAIHYFARSESEQSRSPPSARTAERVVLEFNPNNIAKEGTFEHVLTAYEQKLPVSYRGYIPYGFLGVQKTYYRIFMSYSVVLFSASVLSIISEAWYIITPLFVAAGSICLYLSIEAKRIANNLKEYVGYLHDHKIYLGFELTQDKVAFEAQKAQEEDKWCCVFIGEMNWLTKGSRRVHTAPSSLELDFMFLPRRSMHRLSLAVMCCMHRGWWSAKGSHARQRGRSVQESVSVHEWREAAVCGKDE